MKAQDNILALLHDTCLNQVERVAPDGIRFFFSFYLDDDKECIVEVISENITDVTCTEHYRNDKVNHLDIYALNDIDCCKAELNNETIEMVLEDIIKDTIILLKYSATSHQITGDINQLKEFWDLPVTN